jgi:putative transposase
MWQSRKAKHKESHNVELPYKQKKYLPTGWDYQAISVNYEKHYLNLAGIKGRGKIKCRVKSLPQSIVEVELVYTDKYYLSIKYKEEDSKQLIQSENVCGLDLGEIHAITAVDNNGNAIIITNRKVRSMVRLKDKREGEIVSLRSKCAKGSVQYKKYTKAIYRIKSEFDRKIGDAIHKQTKLFMDYCIKNNIGTVYYGDLDTVTRNSKGRLSEKTNHKLNMWRFGQVVLQLNNKLSRYGIKLVKINEAYTTQTCPRCNNRKKQSNRNYKCKECGYEQHRDIVGAINILNGNSDYRVENYINKVYLQID